ncbi:hypothetical protein [Pseudonocardia sp. ICBG601]|uniref:hypothetical protein n=1 Tax=Pseudonocardia sp. ICBG601 TaxID=2846759 RepID=UPI0035ABCCFB
MSLRVGAGETVAPVGRNRRREVDADQADRPVLRHRRGQVRVDGVDVRRFPLAGYRSRLGVVPQEAHLFTGDVAPTSPTAADRTPRRRRIEAAARAVGALGLVRSLPQGFHTPVGERGQGLSAGPAAARRVGEGRAGRPGTC